MTVKELYEWSKERNVENLELTFSDGECGGEFPACYAEIKECYDYIKKEKYNIVRIDAG